MVITFKILDALQGKRSNIRSRSKISWYFTVIFWFIQAKTPLKDEVKKGKKKVDEQLLCSLILFWELAAAMSAKILFLLA